MKKITLEIEYNGKLYSLETGRFAKFANGAVMVRCGDSMVLVTATCSGEPKDVDFLPLQVEYREKLSAGGKIPGGFLKREGRPSDREVLSARLIDRPIRPMLPKTWRYDTQIIANVLSYDPEVQTDTLAAVGASAALLISDIPYHNPISEVRVGRIGGEFVIDPSVEQLKESDIDMTVAGTDTAITMVEGESQEISETEFLEALDFAHEKIRLLNNLQRSLAEQVEIQTIEVEEEEVNEELVNFVTDLVSEEISTNVHKFSSKNERNTYRKATKEKTVEAVIEKFVEGNEEADEDAIIKEAKKAVDTIEKNIMRKMIIDERVRLDGRKLDEIRPIECETGTLPRTHGSALFTRGETQSLTSLTLGTSRDEQILDGMGPGETERFMLHYNFPPFCVGETGRLGVSRREVGHGHLAWRALKAYLPNEEEFPYTIRVVSDILESNGSSSMATVCAGSLALFNGGVPCKKPVAGIAMGLIKEGDGVAILSDILGDEDHLGDMDFKVAGSVDGITAFQMDIKIEGISVEIMKEALEQARKGRMHILGIMNETLEIPNKELSPYAPRYTSIKIPQDCIGAVIGSGGETIRALTKETNTEINIEDDGTVLIAAVNQNDADNAIARIEALTEQPEEGKVYMAKAVDVRDGLGVICEFLPGTKGLLHISQIAWERVENVAEHFSVGDEFEIKLMEIQRDGKFRLSRKVLLEKPEGYEERPPREHDGNNRRRDNRRDDRRRDNRRDDNRGNRR